MNISEIFSDSFKYPVSDIKKFAIFGIVVVFSYSFNVSKKAQFMGFCV